jgi:hypothetical protein
MIGIAHVITHGSNLLRYITGESPNKEHSEDSNPRSNISFKFASGIFVMCLRY